MKLKRWIALGCLTAALGMLLTGCAFSTELPDGMDEETVIAAGQVVLDELLAEKYEEVAARFREDIRNQKDKEITGEVIKQLVTEHAKPEEVGTFEKVSTTEAEGQYIPDVEPHAVAEFHCEYSKKKVGFGIAFDLEMNLIGLSIVTE